MAFGILQTQIAYAQHEQYWDGSIGSTDITGTCNGSYSSNLEPWPTTAGLGPVATWSGPLSGAGGNSTIVKSIEIPAGKTLIIKGNYEFYTGPNTSTPFVKFLVRKGGTLIIDGGTLTRCGNYDWFWKGVELEGSWNLQQTSANQGTLIMKNGGTIEYAWEGVAADFGGIVQAKNANFINVGRYAAEFLEHNYVSPSGNKLPSVSYFINCIFEANSNYPVRYGACTTDRKIQTRFVSIWKQDDILFSGCEFLNNFGSQLLWHQCGNGIEVTNADLRVQSIDPNVVSSTGDCTIGSGNANKFYGLARGIQFISGSTYDEHTLKVAGTIDVNNPIDLTKKPNEFINCKVGVYTEQAFKPFIFGNIFKIDNDFPSVMDYNAQCDPAFIPQNLRDTFVSGIYLNMTSSDYRVINNYFEYNRISHDEEISMMIVDDPGILLATSGWSGHLTESNRFYGNSPSCSGDGANIYAAKGIWYVDRNTYSEFLCNSFELDNMSVASCDTIYDVLVDFDARAWANFKDQYHLDATNKLDAANTWSTLAAPGHYNLDNKLTSFFDYHHGATNAPTIPPFVNINLIPSTGYDCNLRFDPCGDGEWNSWGGTKGEDPGGPISNKRNTDTLACLQAQFELIQAMGRSITNSDWDLYSSTISQFDMSCTVANYLPEYMEYWLVFKQQVKEGRPDYLLTTDEIAKLELIAAQKSHNARNSAIIKLRYAKEWSERLSTSVAEVRAANIKNLSLYPNPANTVLTIESKELFDGNTVRVYNTLGKIVLTANVNQNSIEINTLPAGSYLLKIEKNDNMYVQKFMVEK